LASPLLSFYGNEAGLLVEVKNVQIITLSFVGCVFCHWLSKGRDTAGQTRIGIPDG